MHILLIADTFPPARNSAAVQLRDLAKEMVIQGHKLTVLAFPGVRHPLEDAHMHERIGNISVSLSKSKKYNSAYYSDGKMSYVLTSDLPSKKMLHLIRSDLTLRHVRYESCCSIDPILRSI